MDRPTHCDELLGGDWPATWSDEDEPRLAELQQELQALLAQLVDALAD
jgi:hypothetical protein